MKRLKTDTELYIEIHGHTDDFGKPGYNRTLSEQRAKTIADYLRENGIQDKRISWYGHGSSKPIASNSSILGRSKNRRVAFKIFIP
ncbi:MAG: OmpA family protein [Croceivirga sp.]